MNALVSTEELAQHPDWRIFDCRHDLGQPELGERQYREAHIPDALFAHLDRDLSAPKSGKNGRHPLPDAKAFGAWLGRQGVRHSVSAPVATSRMAAAMGMIRPKAARGLRPGERPPSAGAALAA